MELSHEQQIAFDKYLNGDNVFMSGPGGSGKSEVIRYIYEDAINKHMNIHVTAMTGCAAVLLNCRANTLHSWAGIGFAKASTESYVKKIRQRQYFKNIWQNTQILIVDEVSMMSSGLFDTLNEIGKEVRRNSKVFGGIQLIFSGDFYQLPPIGDVGCSESTNFCFESSDWFSVFSKQNHVMLVKSFRQKDLDYVSILNQIRVGKIKRKTIETLNNCLNRTQNTEILIKPTKILPNRSSVDFVNQSEMEKLKTSQIVFDMQYLFKGEPKDLEEFSKEFKNDAMFMSINMMCQKSLRLKVGSQVMSIVNKREEGETELLICNGSRGVVTSFCQKTNNPIVKFNDGPEICILKHVWVNERKPEIAIEQLPLVLAWAITIHKSQGCTLDVAEIDIGTGIFECGQTYVALSRVKSLQGLYLTSFDYTKIKVNRKVIDFYQNV
tara:strand:+ start:591 stop:1901 length:1311 start_codon:yes stop_codon:yes gene_type:complete